MKIIDAVILAIVVVWMGSVAMGMYDRSYSVPSTVQMAMGALCAFLFGSKFLKGGN